MSKNNFFYNNRELSWLDFNFRVLEEAMKNDVPILERIKFLSISASNLDEFFMVRVPKIKIQAETKNCKKSKKLMSKIAKKVHIFSEMQYKCFHELILPEFKKINVKFLQYNDLNNKQLEFVKNYFKTVVFPILTPLVTEKSRPFPFLSNISLNIAVKLKSNKPDAFYNGPILGIIQVPSILPRYVKLPDKGVTYYILLEEIIFNNIDKLFDLYKIKSSCIFRITRNFDLDINENTENLILEIENSIKKRKRGKLVRLEIANLRNKKIKKFLLDILNFKKKEIYEINWPLDFTFLSKLYNENWNKKLKFKALSVVKPPRDFRENKDIFKLIREEDRLACHPFESYDSVVKFIEIAANDKNVLAIKQTLYRVSGNSPIINALIKATENGKQVTILLELKARFDEENNINWAKKLEKAGCHVIYGVPNLKTHCKVLLVVRREEDNTVRRYVHLGTGNYNDITAKIYTDISLFTCQEQICKDASDLFNSMTSYSLRPSYRKLIVAPNHLRNFFEKMIKNEIKNVKDGKKGKIIIKINALVDTDIAELLYTASNAGVKIKLIVRGMCCLIPGVKDMSENIEVISIVGRFLEHSRIFYFENGGEPKIYLGSADLMPRNLNKRIEVLFPIEKSCIKKRILKILDVLLKDNVNAREQKSDTIYVNANQHLKNKVNSQMELFKI